MPLLIVEFPEFELRRYVRRLEELWYIDCPHRDWKTLQERLDRVMVRLIARLPPDNARDLAVVNAKIELFEVEDGTGDDIWVLVPL